VTPAPVVFLVDVDNTLLDNDRVQNDLKRHLEREFGARTRDRYGALDVIERLQTLGPTVILADGDVVFQPRKVERSGIGEAVDGNVLIYIGYPGPVLHGRPVVEPHNLGPGWVGFDYHTAFERPVKVVNDAATAWVRPASSRASWSRWSWAICRTEMPRSSTTWGCAACRRTGSSNGGVTSRTSSRG
jgi:hypothetical protein